MAALAALAALGAAVTAGLAAAVPVVPKEAPIFRKFEGKQKGLPPDKLPKWYGRHPNPPKVEKLALEIPGGVQKQTRREAMLRTKLRKGDMPDIDEFERAIQVFASRARQDVTWLPVQRREFMRRAKRWAGEMLLQELQPSARTLQFLLLGCASVGDVSGAEWYVQWMERNNRTLGRLEYNALITAHGIEGNPTKACEWFDKMQASGCAPDAKSYAGKVEAWERVGNRKRMLEVLAQMQEEEASGRMADPVHPRDTALPYYAMARSYVKVADTPRALAVLKHLQAKKIPLTHEAHRLRLEVHLRTPPGPRRSVPEIERAFRDVIRCRPKNGPLYSSRLGRWCRYALGNSRYEEILNEMGTSEEALIPDLPGGEASRRWRRASIQAALRGRRNSGRHAIHRPSEDEKWFRKRLQAREGAKMGEVKGGFRIAAESGLPEWMTLKKPEKHGY